MPWLLRAGTFERWFPEFCKNFPASVGQLTARAIKFQFATLMNTTNLSKAALALVLAAFSTAHLVADVVEIKGGARIVGQVTKIDDGSVVVRTDYAGTLTIKQSEVTSITTDAPVAVRLSSGTRIEGKVSGGPDGSLQIAGADGTISTSVSKVAASWAAGSEDPAVAALQRHWTYEASVDVAGKTGNKEQLGTAGAFRAILKAPQDTLQFYAAYNRQVSDGTKSADQFKAGIDYANNFSGRYSWYARDEAGFDHVKLVAFSNVAAFGLGYDFIKEPKHTLTGRAGVSHRYESYQPNPLEVAKFIVPPFSLAPDAARRLATKETFNSAGLDFGLEHKWEFATSAVVNRLSYVPSFEDFSDYHFTHESFYEIPLANPAWKLRLGISNDYNSKPGKNVERLDTAYFSRLVLSWK